MTTYYVDPVAGDNGDDGLTSGNAFATLAYTNAQLSAGDTVNMMDGTFSENLLATTTGTAGNIITWQAVNSRLCNIQAQICSAGEAYQTFDGIRILGDGTAAGSVRASGDLGTMTNLTWDDCEIFAARRHAFDIEITGDKSDISRYPDTLIIQNCLMDQCHGCIFVKAKNSSYLNNEMRDMRSQTTGDVDYMRPFGRDNLVKGNWAHGTDIANVAGSHTDFVQLFHNNSEINDGLVIEENRIEVIVQGIYMVHRTDGEAIDDITIRNNVFSEPTSGAAGPGETSTSIQGVTSYGVTNLDIDHNTFVYRRDSKAFFMRFHGSKGSGTQSSTGTCTDNIFIRGKSVYEQSQSSVAISTNISSTKNTGDSDDFNSGTAIDPQLIDITDVTGTNGDWLHTDSGWRPDEGTPSRSIDAASDGTDLGAIIAIDDGGPPADTIPPVITLIGADAIQIPDTDVSYTDPGATCVDNLDGVLVMTAGVHDTDGVTANLGTPGSYTYDWDRDDAASNSATTVTRTVIITATPPTPVTSYEIRIVLGAASA